MQSFENLQILPKNPRRFYYSSHYLHKSTMGIPLKDGLAWNQDNVSECGDMSIRGLLFQRASTIKNPTKRVGLVQSGPHDHLIEN